MADRGPILLVDDDPDLRESLQLVLEMNGFLVVAARDGADALEKLACEPRPRVVLLDLMMPGMNGAEFRERQLQDPELRDIPVVLVTGQGSHRMPDAVQGAVLLQKPFDFDELCALLDRLCKGD
jgi:CheY-like chemotaxis protein